MKRHITLLVILVGLAVTVAAQTSNENYVSTHTARIETTGSISGNGDHTQVTRSTQYFDGLGRPMQNIIKRGSPGGYDLITPIEYDEYGRMSKQYLPYRQGSTSGNYRGSWDTEIATFYTNGGDDVVNESTYYYSEKEFEPSPLNRVIEAFGPGSAWRSPDKSVSYTYRPNTSSDAIPMFEVSTSSGQTVDFIQNYPAGELWVTETTDENGNRMLEFKDKLGRIVCKKAEYSTGNFTSTLYLYDYFGNLTFVVPPESAAQASGSWESDLNNTVFRDKWLFRYKYDARQRMIEKQVPGSKPVYMVYDKRDRLVLTQDGNQGSYEVVTTALTVDRYDGNSYELSGSGSVTLSPGFEFSAASGNSFHVSSSVPERTWIYTKYDELNRPVMTGTYISDQTRAQLQSTVDGISDFTEDYTGAGSYHGYNNSGYPTTISEEAILTVTYYDDYDFTSESLPSGAESEVKGQVTGTKTKVLGTDTYLIGITWYDDRYRVIKTKTDNHLGGYDIHDLDYFTKVRGVVKKDTHTHNDGSSNTTIVQEYFYDHLDRLTKTTHKVNSQSTVTLHENDYNELGELIEKDQGGSSSPIQSVDYQYNIRGWITKINNGTSFDDGSDKFGMELQYDAAGQWNGNIGEMRWKAAQGTGIPSNTQSYDYSYDKLNRITGATYNGGLSGANHNNVSGITYDKNGNILTLIRKLNNTNTDNLDYDYDGNQLTTVGDSYNNNLFDESLSEGKVADEYLYDMNGNMIRDLNKGISSISYNYLNLPEKVNLPGGDYVKYTYDAAGMKLSKESKQGSNTETTDYVASFHYVDDAIVFIQHAEGRTRKNGSSYVYEYNLTDHLGNVRVSVDQSGTVIQRDDYYPFGLTFNHWNDGDHNRYKYNGKEEQEETGLIDFDTRFYDPALARFGSVDPIAKNYYLQSPYVYAANSPIRYIDLMGLGPWDDVKKGFSGLWGSLTSSESYAEVGKGFNELGRRVRKDVSQALQKLENSMTGNEPDRRGDGDKTNMGGETYTKKDGFKGSQGIQGKPKNENDMTTLANAKSVGPAATSTPSSNIEIVKDLAEYANNILDITQSTPEDKPAPGKNLGGVFNFSDSTSTSRFVDSNGDTITVNQTKEEIFGD